MGACFLCPRSCGIDRSVSSGRCGVGENLKVARAALHMWEEPCISGERGSGTVFFSGCSLACVYCQNIEISRGLSGKEIDVPRLAEIFLELEQKGASNINLVTPTHFSPQIIRALGIAKGRGLSIPIVYNTGGYERVDALKALKGYVDIYLADFKYFSEKLAKRYSGAADYPAVACEALDEMLAQVGEPVFDEDGIMKRGMIVRHLVLPGFVNDSKRVMKYLYGHFGDSIFISIMNQFTPNGRLQAFPEIDRKVTPEEYAEVVDFAIGLGVENGFTQEEGTAALSFIPPFDNFGV